MENRPIPTSGLIFGVDLVNTALTLFLSFVSVSFLPNIELLLVLQHSLYFNFLKTQITRHICKKKVRFILDSEQFSVTVLSACLSCLSEDVRMQTTHIYLWIINLKNLVRKNPFVVLKQRQSGPADLPAALTALSHCSSAAEIERVTHACCWCLHAELSVRSIGKGKTSLHLWYLNSWTKMVHDSDELRYVMILRREAQMFKDLVETFF